MAQPNPDSAWILPLIAGVFALLGVTIGQFLTMLSAWFERKRRRNEMLLRKLDELTVEMCKVLEWHREIEKSNSLLQVLSLSPSLPCYRLEALSLLYFRTLQPAVAAYTAQLRAYYEWACQTLASSQKDRELSTTVGVLLHIVDSSLAKQHSEQIDKRHADLAAAIATEAQRYLSRA